MKFRGKLLFISSYSPESKVNVGVNKKISLQIKTFSEMGFEVDYTVFKDNSVFIGNNFITQDFFDFNKTMISFYRYLIKNPSILKEYEVIYMRYEHISFPMLKCLKFVKSHYRTLIIAELPTYNTKWEPGSSWITIIRFIVKMIFNQLFSRHIDRMVIFSKQKKMFGIPTISISNFADYSKLNMNQESRGIGSKEINLIGVASSLTASVGYERIIKGMRDFYSTGSDRQYKVKFHIVGEGKSLINWKDMVRRFGLTEYVIFHGFLNGSKLDEVFEISDIGVAKLANFKLFFKVNREDVTSHLKVREFMARGLPFIYSSYEDDVLGQPFALKFVDNNDSINIDKIVNFFIQTRKIKPESIRIFAAKKFSCRIQMEKVFQGLRVS